MLRLHLNCATLGNARLASNANLSHRKRPNLVRVKTFLGRKHPRATARTARNFRPLQWDDRPSREPRATNGRGYCMSQTQRSHTAVPVHSPNSRQDIAPRASPGRPRFRASLGSFLRKLGPGLITGASDDDPSGIATYSQVGAQFGYGMLWTMLISYPLMGAIQEISARIGRVTGCGIAANLQKVLSALATLSGGRSHRGLQYF